MAFEHSLLIAKLTPDMQEKALDHCFDGYGARDDSERSLVAPSRLQEWITRNAYLGLKSAVFSKDDETLLPEAGSCATCPKRTGFNTFLFSEAREDSCTDAACFNRKLDAHIAQRVAKMPNLAQISHDYRKTDETPVLPRPEYIEVVARKTAKSQDARPEQKLCNHLTPAIYTDGADKGRLVNICANPECKVHFGNRKREEEQRLRWKAGRAAENRKAKQALIFRHRLFSVVLQRVKPQLRCEELCLVTRFVLNSLSHDLVCRLAKRRGLQNGKEPRDWQTTEKVRTLYKKLDAAQLAVLLFESMLLGSVANTNPDRNDDPLAAAATLSKVNVKALRTALAKEEKTKEHKRAKTLQANVKSK